MYFVVVSLCFVLSIYKRIILNKKMSHCCLIKWCWTANGESSGIGLIWSWSYLNTTTYFFTLVMLEKVSYSLWFKLVIKYEVWNVNNLWTSWVDTVTTKIKYTKSCKDNSKKDNTLLFCSGGNDKKKRLKGALWTEFSCNARDANFGFVLCA